jgi:hypothetical protein
VPKLPLPWDRSIDHHKSIKYAETEARPQVPFAVTRETDGHRVSFLVSGNCPACGGLVTKEFSYGIAGTKGFRGPATPTVPATATLYCECGHVHPDKPASAIDDGCGRFWRIDLTAS